MWKYLIASGFKTIRITSGKFDDENRRGFINPGVCCVSVINNLASTSRCLISDKLPQFNIVNYLHRISTISSLSEYTP
ncbi:hypothetical protein FEK47_06830 [Escherichia sp. E3659]|nr:hypothetical protein FEK47_06830 [Escherichia sp. E3659]